jgi:proteasome accessory factor B
MVSMPDATERLVNLALYLADAREPVTARDVRDEVAGYPPEQDEEAFLRMFERDKKELRTAGLVIETEELSSGRAYRLDRGATFQTRVDLSPEHVAVLRAAGSAFLSDPEFPLRDALLSAMAKLSVPPVTRPAPAAHREDPGDTDVTTELAWACMARKRSRFDYHNARGVSSLRDVEPYGLFTRDGRWYLVAADRDRDDVRVFAVRRMTKVSVERSAPETPDFEPPSDLDVRDYARLPFQYGDAAFEARIAFDPEFSWRAPTLAEGRGRLEHMPDGSVAWTVGAADEARLARWVLENGPGLTLVRPASAVEMLLAGLSRVEAAHG